MRSFLRYIGGKSRLARVIAGALPRGRCYVEVFGGAGWVLFAKEPEPAEVLNDIDGRLVNLYRVVRDRPRALARELILLPRSRRLFYELLRTPCETDPVRAAAVFYFLMRNSFSGRLGHGFATSRVAPGRYSMRADFSRWAARLATVTVENLPYESCLVRYDARATVFYLDPPYWGLEKYYGDYFTAEDHKRLAGLLGEARGRWLLSYNDCAAVRRLYRRFHVRPVAAGYSAALATRRRRPKARAAELLISNF